MIWIEKLARRISAGNRGKKWRLFMEIVGPSPRTRVLDVGYSDREYAETDNYLEKHYPYPGSVTALGVEDPSSFQARYPDVHVVQYAGGVFPFADKVFDVAWSNAVIEHVGGWDDQVSFLKEMHRVASLVILTTPNRFFPVEVHTRIPLLHYLPKRLFDAFLRWVGKGWAAGGYMNLLSLGQVKRLLRAADIRTYRIVRNRLLWFTMDFVVIAGEQSPQKGEGASA